MSVDQTVKVICVSNFLSRLFEQGEAYDGNALFGRNVEGLLFELAVDLADVLAFRLSAFALKRAYAGYSVEIGERDIYVRLVEAEGET